MTSIKEQQQRHAATMDFFRSGKQLAEQIAAELKRIDAEAREQLEVDYRGRMVNAEVADDE